MEDGVADSECLIHLENPTSRGGPEEVDEEENKEYGEEQRERALRGEAAKEAEGRRGVVTNLFSNLVSQVNQNKDGIFDVGNGGSGSEDDESEGVSGGKNISNFISNLFKQSGSEREAENDENREKAVAEDEPVKTQGEVHNIVSHLPECLQEDDESEDVSRGKHISNFISNLFKQSGSEREAENEENREEAVAEDEPVKTQGEVKGGGIIHSIVSNLPESFQDEVPAADEASILIHSIVHD